MLTLLLASTLSTVLVFAQPILPPSGLVGWWPGDGNANDIVDGNPGTLLNGATFAAGMVEQAFSLDGVDDAVWIPESGVNLDGFSELTIDAWIYPDAVDGVKTIVSKYDSRLINYYGVSYSLSARDGGKLQMAICESIKWESAYITSVDLVIIPGVWTHVAGVWKGDTELELYVDGIPVDGTITTQGVVGGLYMADNDVPVNIGRVESLQIGVQKNYFDGLIDEVEIFNRALTQSEIQDIYNAGSDGKSKTPTPVPEFSLTLPVVTSLAAAIYLALRKRIGKKPE